MRFPFQKIYTFYMVLWPGLALLSLRYIPQIKNHWLVPLLNPATILILFCLLIAACAVYFVFPTEVISVPRSPVAAFTFVFELPLHLLVLLITTPENIWEVIALGFCVQGVLAVSAIAVMVFERIKRWQENPFAVVLLLGIAIAYLGIVLPFMISIVEGSVWSYIVLASSSIVGIIQHIRQMKSGERADLPDAAFYILVGVFGIFLLPGLGALAAYL